MSRTPLLARQVHSYQTYTMRPRPGKPHAGHGPAIRRPPRAARLGIEPTFPVQLACQGSQKGVLLAHVGVGFAGVRPCSAGFAGNSSPIADLP